MNIKNIPIFIVCRDRVSDLALLVSWFQKNGFSNIVLVDNNSLYPPLLEFYENCECQVIRLKTNKGCGSPWKYGLVQEIAKNSFYILSDPDVIPIKECPADVVARMYKLLLKYPQYEKVGMGLKIDDLPDHYKFKDEVIQWESQFHQTEVEPGVYEAPVDTTFALYRPGVSRGVEHMALRTAYPYEARHMAWYANSGSLTPEEQYYNSRAKASISTWGKDELSPQFEKKIENLGLTDKKESNVEEKEIERSHNLTERPTTEQQRIKHLARNRLYELARKVPFNERANLHASDFSSSGPHYESLDPLLQGVSFETELLAYYLPQFHPIPENDLWWGKGFTEWHNVNKARPRYRGHYQPRSPLDLGFYNLLSSNVMHQQASLARAVGISSWCFYYYDFGGRRVMDKALAKFLQDSSIDMKFCLMWANENWARTWQGSNEVLIRQSYDPEHDQSLLAGFVQHFEDDRYIKIDGKPLLFIYKPAAIPNAKQKIESLRDLLYSQFSIEAHLFMAQTYGDHDPVPYGLDGAIEFPPHGYFRELPSKTTQLEDIHPDFSGEARLYDDLVYASLSRKAPDYDLIKCVVPSWDNEPRRTNSGYSYVGTSPVKYEDWLSQAIEYSAINPVLGKRFVAVNAWNEWAEGAYLEPDIYYGSAYLNATKRALIKSD